MFNSSHTNNKCYLMSKQRIALFIYLVPPPPHYIPPIGPHILKSGPVWNVILSNTPVLCGVAWVRLFGFKYFSNL